MAKRRKKLQSEEEIQTDVNTETDTKEVEKQSEAEEVNSDDVEIEILTDINTVGGSKLKKGQRIKVKKVQLKNLIEDWYRIV